MDVTSIASSAVNMTQPGTLGNAVGLVMMRKAMDMDAQNVAQLVQSVAPGGGSNPPHLGNSLDALV